MGLVPISERGATVMRPEGGGEIVGCYKTAGECNVLNLAASRTE